MAKVQKFEELKIWQVAREVAKRVYELTRSGEFAKDFGLKDQIQRAAVRFQVSGFRCQVAGVR